MKYSWKWRRVPRQWTTAAFETLSMAAINRRTLGDAADAVT